MNAPCSASASAGVPKDTQDTETRRHGAKHAHGIVQRIGGELWEMMAGTTEREPELAN